MAQDREVDVYLDVDGVLNALAPYGSPWRWGPIERARINGFVIQWSPALIARVNALAARPEVRMHWLTTWCGDAATMLAPRLGLHGQNWPVVGEEFHDDHEMRTWWKLEAMKAREHAASVWVDDDLIDSGAHAWLAERDTVLPIRPESSLGITPEQMDQIEAYVDEVLSGREADA